MGIIHLTSKADIKKGSAKTVLSLGNIHQPVKTYGIPLRFLNTKINIKRKTTTKDSVGDLTEVFAVIQYNIPANIQPFSGEDSSQEQGRLLNYTHTGFLPKEIARSGRKETIDIREDDNIYDQETNVTYRLRRIDDMIPARKSKSDSKYSHYEIALEKINDNRYGN